MMTKNNSVSKLDRNYEQTNLKLLSSSRKLRSKSQITSNKNQDTSIKNGFTPRISPRRKKSCETGASRDNQDIIINSSSAETTTDSTSTICKEKFLGKFDLHVKPKVEKIPQFFTCELCEEDFISANYLRHHAFRVHKIIIDCKQTTKVSNNLNHKQKPTLMRDKVRRFAFLRQRYEVAKTQLNKFNTRFVTKVSEERKKRRKLFREQIKMSVKNKSNDRYCKKMTEVEDKSNLQVPTSTVEIDESSKDNVADRPTSTSETNDYKSQSKSFISKFKEFVLSNGDVINLSNIEGDDGSKEILSILSDNNLTFELPDRKSGKHKIGNNSIGLKTSDDAAEPLPVSTPSEPVKLRTYKGKKDANQKYSEHGYCKTCTKSLNKLDTHYQTDNYGTRKIHCTFCSHKFMSVNGLYRHVALYHLKCTCIRTKCHWYNPFAPDTKQLDPAAPSTTHHCNHCSKDYEEYKTYNYHHFTFHVLEPVSDELVEKTPKYLKDPDNNFLIKRWVPSARKTNFYGKILSNNEYDEDYDNDSGIDLWPLVCQKCGEIYFNCREYIFHLDSCYFKFDLRPITPITQYPDESKTIEDLRESSLKPESNRRVDFVVRPNIKLQFFPQDVKTKPRNPRKMDTNYDLLRRSCRRCNKLFGSVNELTTHYRLVHENSANSNNNNNNSNNNNNNNTNKNNNSNNSNAKVDSDEKTSSDNNNTKTNKKDYDDENNITYYNYKYTPWYGHNVRHKWQCVHCKLSFKIFRAFSNHLFFEHNDESLIHICENCDEILTNLDQINKHLCVNVSSWICKLCDLKFGSGLEFRAHNTKNHYELFEPSVCLACGKKFLTHYMLNRHMKNKQCSSERVIDDLISTYSQKPKKVNPPAVIKKDKKKAADSYVIILNNIENTVEKDENQEKAEDVTGLFELVDCSKSNLIYDLEKDEASNKPDVEVINILEDNTKVISDKAEEMKKQVPETEGETIKESIEEATNDEDDAADEESFDDTPIDDESVIEDTNDEDSGDESEDDDDEDDDDDIDEEDLDDEELDDEEFDDEESVDIDNDDLKTNDDNYNELMKMNVNCNKIEDINEDTYDELEGIKNYVLDNDKKSVNSVSSKRKRTDGLAGSDTESLADKKKKLTDVHDTFNAQVDQKEICINNSAGTSHKVTSQIVRCSMCKLQFPSMALLNNHFNRAHTSAVEICQLCYKMYITGNLVKHMVKDHFNAYTTLADSLMVFKDEISIERDTRDFIGIVGRIHLLALCKYQEPPQASSEESVDCSDCSLTFENADKYRIHNVDVHDKFCALCISKFRSGQEAAKHKIEIHGSTACYVWFASKMINAIGDTDTFKEAVGLKSKKRKPKTTEGINSNNSKSKHRYRNRNININVSSNINIDSNVNINMISHTHAKSDDTSLQDNMTLKDKILDILRKSQPTLDRLNSQIQSTHRNQQGVEKQPNDNPQGVRQIGKKSNLQEALNNIVDVEKPKTLNKTPLKDDKLKITKSQTQIEAYQPPLNQVSIKNNNTVQELSILSEVLEISDDKIIIKCSNKLITNDNNENDSVLLIVVEKDDLRKYKNNLRELAARYVSSTNMSTEEMVQILQEQLDNI